MNKLETILHNISKGFADVFKDVDKAAVIAEPFVDYAFPALAPLYNAGSNGAAAAILAAQKVNVPTATDAQNLVSIAIAVEPILKDFATQTGLSIPTSGAVIGYAGAIQESLKRLQPAPAA
jgi:hypothetical protein